MLVEEQVEFTGISGTTYSFKVYPKSAELPTTGGIFILTYMHPRGHLAGFAVHPLHIGAAGDLHSTVQELKTGGQYLENCWNYTCVINIDTAEMRDACLTDLRQQLL